MLIFYSAIVTSVRLSFGTRESDLVYASLPVLQTTSSRNARLHLARQSPYRFQGETKHVSL